MLVFIPYTWSDGSLGSQNLTGRLIKFEDYCLLQRDALPVRKGQTLKWIGVTEEGVRLFSSTRMTTVLMVI